MFIQTKTHKCVLPLEPKQHGVFITVTSLLNNMVTGKKRKKRKGGSKRVTAEKKKGHS